MSLRISFPDLREFHPPRVLGPDLRTSPRKGTAEENEAGDVVVWDRVETQARKA